MLVREGVTRRFERPMVLSGLRRPVRRTVEVLGVVGQVLLGVFGLAEARWHRT